jgi:hypothetical protein
MEKYAAQLPERVDALLLNSSSSRKERRKFYDDDLIHLKREKATQKKTKKKHITYNNIFLKQLYEYVLCIVHVCVEY